MSDARGSTISVLRAFRLQGMNRLKLLFFGFSMMIIALKLNSMAVLKKCRLKNFRNLAHCQENFNFEFNITTWVMGALFYRRNTIALYMVLNKFSFNNA